jgi:cystathionine gamma-synthase
MSARDLLQNPVWRAEELGQPMPESLHAISMALPRWQDVVAYEEKDAEVSSRLEIGYPRFVIHPLVKDLAGRIAGTQPCLPFPSLQCAEWVRDFVHNRTGAEARIVPYGKVFGVVTDPAGSIALKEFWQHTGLIVSSRQAEAELAGGTVVGEAMEVRDSLRRQLAQLYECAKDDVFLAPTGMAAQHAALRVINARRPGLPTAQLGFPYVDTLKLQQKVGRGGMLLHRLETIEADLSSLMQRQPLGACFGEIPGNPLLGSADLRRISPILRNLRIPLVADDVVATPLNVDLSPYADLIATSLTKYVAGTADVMGGALICNPRSPLYDEIKGIAIAQHQELLWPDDAVVLDRQARGFPERMRQHNRNGLIIAERLKKHPAIERVWYPKWEFAEVYEAVRRPDGGWGSLITFLPRNAERCSPVIFDALEVCKGPSLGTVFTLACPFTLLAHYTELEWAEACGVSRHLIRISVGLEDAESLWKRIERALQGVSIRLAG